MARVPPNPKPSARLEGKILLVESTLLKFGKEPIGNFLIFGFEMSENGRKDG